MNPSILLQDPFKNNQIQNIVTMLMIKPGETLADQPFALITKHQKGYYTFPGGKRNPDEDPFSATLRELYEETGIQLPPEYCVALNPTTIRSREGTTYTVDPFLAFWFDDLTDPQTIETQKHTHWQWVPLNQIKNLIIEGEIPWQLFQRDAIPYIADCLLHYFNEETFESDCGLLDECQKLNDELEINRVHQMLMNC